MRNSDLDAMQGDGEERTEAYKQYDEGAPQPSTPQSAKSDSGAAGSAGRQAGAVRDSLNDSMEEAILYAKKVPGGSIVLFRLEHRCLCYYRR